VAALRASGVPVVMGKRLERQALREEDLQADGDGRQHVARDDAGRRGEQGGDPAGVGCRYPPADGVRVAL